MLPVVLQGWPKLHVHLRLTLSISCIVYAFLPPANFIFLACNLNFPPPIYSYCCSSDVSEPSQSGLSHMLCPSLPHFSTFYFLKFLKNTSWFKQ